MRSRPSSSPARAPRLQVLSATGQGRTQKGEPRLRMRWYMGEEDTIRCEKRLGGRGEALTLRGWETSAVSHKSGEGRGRRRLHPSSVSMASRRILHTGCPRSVGEGEGSEGRTRRPGVDAEVVLRRPSPVCLDHARSVDPCKLNDESSTVCPTLSSSHHELTCGACVVGTLAVDKCGDDLEESQSRC